MRIWIDTEFNGFKGELISMALCAENGMDWYVVLPLPEKIDPWVAEHVVPILLISPRTVAEARHGLHWFLNQFESIHLIADWPEDIAHFCRLLLTEKPGERIDTPPLTMQIVREDFPSQMPHNALWDARGMRQKCMIPNGE